MPASIAVPDDYVSWQAVLTALTTMAIPGSLFSVYFQAYSGAED